MPSSPLSGIFSFNFPANNSTIWNNKFAPIPEPHNDEPVPAIEWLDDNFPIPPNDWLKSKGIIQRNAPRGDKQQYCVARSEGKVFIFPSKAYIIVPWLKPHDQSKSKRRPRSMSPRSGPDNFRYTPRSRTSSPERPIATVASQESSHAGTLVSTIPDDDIEVDSPSNNTPKASRAGSPSQEMPSQLSTRAWSESDNGLPGYRREGWGLYNQIAYALKTDAAKDAKSQYADEGNIAAVSLFSQILDDIAIIIKSEEPTTDPTEYSQLRHRFGEIAIAFAKDIKPLSLEDTDLFASRKSLTPEPTYSKPNNCILDMLESINTRLDKIEGRSQHNVGTFQSIHTPSFGPFANPALLPASQRVVSAPQSQPSRPIPTAPVPQPPTPKPRVNAAPKPRGNGPQAPNRPKPKPLPKVDQVRFVIRCNKSNIGPNTLTNRTIVDKVNTIISKASNNPPRAIGASWNRSNNIILVFPSSLNPDLITLHSAAILQTLGLPPDTAMSRDVAWSKIMITHVPTGLVAEGDEVFLDESVANNFIGDNEWASALKFTMRPRWLLKPDTIKKSMSSVVLAFEDPDGAIARDFLRKPIWMFGNSCRSKRWEDKPVLQQCDKCQQLGHIASACKRKDACGICAGPHKTFNHNVSCKHCRDANILVSDPCPHPFKCVNCQGPHQANDPSCPRRSKFRAPRKSSDVPSSQPAADGMDME